MALYLESWHVPSLPQHPENANHEDRYYDDDTFHKMLLE